MKSIFLFILVLACIGMLLTMVPHQMQEDCSVTAAVSPVSEIPASVEINPTPVSNIPTPAEEDNGTPIEAKLETNALPETADTTFKTPAGESTLKNINLPEEIINGASDLYYSWLDDNNGYLLKKGYPAAGQMHSFLYHTIDNKTWTLVNDELSRSVHNYPNGIFFWNENSGVIFTDYHGFNEVVYLTTDGGINWKAITIDLKSQLGNYSYLEGVNGYLDENGQVMIQLDAVYNDTDERILISTPLIIS